MMPCCPNINAISIGYTGSLGHSGGPSRGYHSIPDIGPRMGMSLRQGPLVCTLTLIAGSRKSEVFHGSLDY